MELFSNRAPVALVLALSVMSAAAWGQTTSAPAALAKTPDADVSQAVAPETVTVTATRVETKLSEVGSDVTVLTAKDFANTKLTNVADVLRDVPGVTVSRSGGLGQATSVFIRGNKSEHTLVLIDGVPANDPTTPGATFDFSRLSLDNVDRIEVLRGPQSTLYGSDAIGGVVSITTKSGGGKPTGYLTLEYGSFQTFRESAGASGGNKEFKFSVAGSRTDSQGLSAAAAGNERDGYGATQGSVKLSLDPTGWIGFDLISRASDAQTAIDGFSNTTFLLGDTNAKNVVQEYYNLAQMRLSLCDDKWQQKVGLSYNKIDRETITSPGYGDDTVGQDSFHGSTHRVDWQNDLYFVENNIFTFGLDAEEQGSKTSSFNSIYGSSASDDSRWQVGGFAQDQLKMFKPFYLTIGGRADGYQDIGTALTYRIAPSLVIEQTDSTFKASHGTGFKAPTLFQLFSSYGNPGLQPEHSCGFDAGVEQRLFDKRVTVGATYFYNNIQNMIDYDFTTSKYNNVASANTQGVETMVSWKVTKDLSLSGTYTYTETRDLKTGEQLLRRPYYAAGVALDYAFLKQGHLNVGADYTGARADEDPNLFVRIENKEYWWTHVAVSWDFTEHVQVFARFENPLNVHYQEVAGYNSPGCAAYAGLKLSF